MDGKNMTPEGEPSQLPRRSSRNQRKRRINIWWKIAGAAALAIVFGVGAGFFWLRSLEGKMQLAPKDMQGVQQATKPPTDNTLNVLLVGTDRRPGSNSARADTIVFLRIDKEAKKAYMLSIPRDTRVEIRGHGLDKINHSWAFGNAPLLIETVSNFIGLPVNYLFQVDFMQFEKAVDALGGVEFTSNTSWTDGELGVTVRAGNYRRYGKEALAIVRNRSWGAGRYGSDFTRVGIQQEFIKATIAQSVGSVADVPRAANVAASYVNTNMRLTEMLGLGRSFAGETIDTQSTMLKGTPAMIGGVSYVVPDEAAKKEAIKAMLSNQPFPEQ